LQENNEKNPRYFLQCSNEFQITAKHLARNVEAWQWVRVKARTAFLEV
jgi:hypothetical protein